MLVSNNRISVQIYERIASKKKQFSDFKAFLSSLHIETKKQFLEQKDLSYALGTQDATTLALSRAYNLAFNAAADCTPSIVEKIMIGKTAIRYSCQEHPIFSSPLPFTETLEQIAKHNAVGNKLGSVGFKTGTAPDGKATRLAGVYTTSGHSYAVVVDVDGRGKSLGNNLYAVDLNVPILRQYLLMLGKSVKREEKSYVSMK